MSSEIHTPAPRTLHVFTKDTKDATPSYVNKRPITTVEETPAPKEEPATVPAAPVLTDEQKAEAEALRLEAEAAVQAQIEKDKKEAEKAAKTATPPSAPIAPAVVAPAKTPIASGLPTSSTPTPRQDG